MHIEKDKFEESGFTLLETLIGINLAFVLVSAVFSFYLLTVKFSSAIHNRVEKSGLLLISLDQLGSELNKSDALYLGTTDSKSWIYDSDRIVVQFKGTQFAFAGTALLDTPDSIFTLIRFSDNSETHLYNGIVVKRMESSLLEGDKTSKIKEMEITLFCNNVQRRWYYAPRPFAANRFTNIDEIL